ncbi:MAG: (deoxy)nucleoside triphosphate pyrophosphohydrolase [Marmoricola sp.]|nr:(deoxy)nucleoside triphosphate pyrophosphohydrolase [Marmoricola sp.]
MQTVVGVAILDQGRVLAARRASGPDAGGWEFPGGKVELGESPEQAAVREIGEELGCVVEVVGWFDRTEAISADLELRVALGRLVSGDPVPQAGDHDEIRWLTLAELGTVPWLAADVPFVSELTDQPVGGAH